MKWNKTEAVLQKKSDKADDWKMSPEDLAEYKLSRPEEVGPSGHERSVTIYKNLKGGKDKEKVATVEINWSAWGSQNTKTTKVFCDALMKAIERADEIKEDLKEKGYKIEEVRDFK